MTNALPEAASDAWAAYIAMTRTKQRHLDYLLHLEEKYQQGGESNAVEAAMLEQLLAAHDARVAAFKQALIMLKTTDPQAHAALIARLAATGSE